MRKEYIKDIKNNIFYNCDNLEIIDITKYLLQVVINDIGLMNNLINEKENYNLGNNYKIKNEDLESLCSIIDTMNNIVEYNNEIKNEVE